MKKAKSRLKPSPTENSASPALSVQTPSEIKVNRPRPTKINSYLGDRTKHLPTLGIGLFFILLLLIILIFVSPAQVKDFLLPNSYFLFLGCLFLSSFFLLSWLFLDSLIGMWWAIWLTGLVFLRIQQVVLGWPELVVFTLGFAIGALFQIWRQRLKKNLIHH